jgi:cytochrome c-type biogenesis protein CcmF
LMMLGGFVWAGDKRFRIKRSAKIEEATAGLQVQETRA